MKTDDARSQRIGRSDASSPSENRADQIFSLRWICDDYDGVTTTNTSNSQNKLTSSVTNGVTATLTYDNNGNTLSDSSGTVYTYDALDRRVTDLNRRKPGVEAADLTRQSLYYSMQGQVIEERSPFINPSTGAVTMVTSDQYIWGAGYVNDLILRDRNTYGLTATGDEGGTGSGLDERIYALYDANWDITAITDTGGNVLEQFVYSPYGVRSVVTPAGNHLMADGYNWVYGFQGERTDPITGEVESASREEDPTTGTWNEQDPAGYVNGANTYQFVGSNPVNGLDPTGLMFLPDRLFGVLCSDGTTPVEFGTVLELDRVRKDMDNELSPYGVQHGVVIALNELGIAGVNPQVLNINFARISFADFNTIRCSGVPLTSGVPSKSHKYGAFTVPLRDGFELKLYPNGPIATGPSFDVAVVDSDWWQHAFDYLAYDPSGHEVNGDIAEKYGGFATVSDAYWGNFIDAGFSASNLLEDFDAQYPNQYKIPSGCPVPGAARPGYPAVRIYNSLGSHVGF